MRITPALASQFVERTQSLWGALAHHYYILCLIGGFPSILFFGREGVGEMTDSRQHPPLAPASPCSIARPAKDCPRNAPISEAASRATEWRLAAGFSRLLRQARPKARPRPAAADGRVAPSPPTAVCATSPSAEASQPTTGQRRGHAARHAHEDNLSQALGTRPTNRVLAPLTRYASNPSVKGSAKGLATTRGMERAEGYP